jgi:lipid-A-disaccharide synthase
MPFEPFNRMGFGEVVLHLPFFIEAQRRLVEIMRLRPPDALVCVDYPGFNMRLMQRASALHVPVVWYIVPQVWAWKKARAATLGRHASFIGAVFPFETGFFEKYSSAVEFVGHPLVEALAKEGSGDAFPPARFRGAASRIAIVPGSRPQEVRALLPPMVEAFRLLRREFPGLSAVVSRMPHLDKGLFPESLEREGLRATSESLDELLRGCDLALVTSGTATLQTALQGVPMVIAYRTSPLTYALGRRLVKIRFIGLPNIVAGEEIVPERIQAGASPSGLADALRQFVLDQKRYEAAAAALRAIKEKLGDRRPSEVMADRILRVCGRGP